jgi:hypothetical protein
MKTSQKQTLLQASICLISVVLVFIELYILGPSEFSGGSVTGPLFKLAETGAVFSMIGFLLAFVFRRAAATLSLIASLLCLPLYLFLMFPAASRKIFRGGYSTRLGSMVIWDKWLILGLLALGTAIYIGYRNLIAANNGELLPRG